MIAVRLLDITDDGYEVFCTLDNNGPNGAAQLVSGKDFNPEVGSILDSGIWMTDRVILRDDPNRWLRHLPVLYNSSRFRAEVIEDTDPPDPPLPKDPPPWPRGGKKPKRESARIVVQAVLREADDGCTWRTIGGHPVCIKGGHNGHARTGHEPKDPGGGSPKLKKGEFSDEDVKAAIDAPFTEPPPALKKLPERRYTGKHVKSIGDPGKDVTGSIAEAAAITWLRAQGFNDARPLKPRGRNNYAVDIIYDSTIAEVKGGYINSTTPRWRHTEGEPNNDMKKMFKHMASDDRFKFGQKEKTKTFARKDKAHAQVERVLGRKIHRQTITMIVDPKSGKSGVVDVHAFEGWHREIPWKSEKATQGYKDTFSYALQKGSGVYRKATKTSEANRATPIAWTDLPPDEQAFWADFKHVPGSAAAIRSFLDELDADAESWVTDVIAELRTTPYDATLDRPRATAS